MTSAGQPRSPQRRRTASSPPTSQCTGTHVDRVFETLSYFDGSVLARTAQALALFSVGLMDETCPPSTVFAAYNAYAGPNEIRVYPFNEHEGGQSFHEVEQLRWKRDHMGAPF